MSFLSCYKRIILTYHNSLVGVGRGSQRAVAVKVRPGSKVPSSLATTGHAIDQLLFTVGFTAMRNSKTRQDLPTLAVPEGNGRLRGGLVACGKLERGHGSEGPTASALAWGTLKHRSI